jgi:hypothetical protein
MATDQEIRDRGIKFLPKQQYLQSPYQFNEPVVEEEVTETFGIPNTNAFTNSRGDNYTGSYNFNNNGFQQAVDARQRNLNKPTDTSTFMGRTMGKVRDFIEPQSASQIMTDGYQEPRFQPGIMATIMGKLDNYRNLPRADQAFIAQNMGYTGPTVFGENNSGLGKDPFGINTRSAFGNYGEYVGNAVTDLEEALGKARGKYDTEKEYLDMTKLMRTKLNFYRTKQKEREQIQGDVLAGQMQRDAEAGAAGKSDSQDKSRAGSLGRRPGSGGNVTAQSTGTVAEGRNTDDTGQTYDSGGREGFGYGLKDGGRAGYFFGGRVNYKVGGRTDAESQYGADSVGSYDSSQNRSDREQSYGGNNKPPVSNDNSVVTTDFISKKPSLTIDYTDPKNYASIYSKMGFNNFLDNDDLTVEGDFATNMGPVTTNTKFTDDGIGNTDINYGNFSTTIDPNKNIKNIGYNNSYNGINYGVNYADGNTMFNVGTTFKNGGLASIL